MERDKGGNLVKYLIDAEPDRPPEPVSMVITQKPHDMVPPRHVEYAVTDKSEVPTGEPARRKRGRPPGRKKPYTVQVCLTPDLHAALLRRCGQTGLTKSEEIAAALTKHLQAEGEWTPNTGSEDHP